MIERHFGPAQHESEDVRKRKKILEAIRPINYITDKIREAVGKSEDKGETEQAESLATSLHILHFLDAIPNGRALFRKNLQQEPSSNDPQSAERTAHSILSFIANHVPLEKLEALEREYNSKQEGYINELLHYTVHEHELALHVAPASTLPLKTKICLMREGFQALAHEFVRNTTLQHINVIRNKSWIVKEYPDLLRKLGFQVGEFDMSDDESFDYNEDVASMPKEEFIRRYSSYHA